MAIARNPQERIKVVQVIRMMLESSFYLEMKLQERLKLIKMMVANST